MELIIVAPAEDGGKGMTLMEAPAPGEPQRSPQLKNKPKEELKS